MLTLTAGLSSSFLNRMPWPYCWCCCESSLSFGGTLERGGKSLSPELALQSTQMPCVPCARASRGKELLDPLQWWNEGHETWAAPLRVRTAPRTSVFAPKQLKTSAHLSCCSPPTTLLSVLASNDSWEQTQALPPLPFAVDNSGGILCWKGW